MRVLSLFDGMACGFIALKQAGIPVLEYHAFEIDKYAIQVAKVVHPEIIHHGDVCNADWNEFKGFDLVIAGSPCQGFSFAGKQLAFDDPRSKLFFEFVKALNTIKPKYFLLENVKMKKEYLDIISQQVGVEPVLINSALVSAQNRQRYYWSNIPITQPEDRGILLKDIIEFGVVDRDKSYCIDANYWKVGNLKSYFEKHRRQLVFNKPNCVGTLSKKGYERDNRVYSVDGKSPTILAHSGGNKEVKILCKEVKVLCTSEVRPDGKTCALNTVQKDNVIVSIEQRPHGFNKGGEKSINGKTPTLTSNSWEHNNILKIREKSKTVRSSDMGSYDRHEWDSISTCHTRKLTPRECFRLQTIPENIINRIMNSGVSNTQLYKIAGNGWTAEVPAGIFRGIL